MNISWHWQFLFLYFIVHWAWDHFGPLRWTNQMGFNLRSEIQRLRQDTESKWLLCLWPDGNILSLVHWWEKNICRTCWCLKTKQVGSQKWIQTEAKSCTVRAMPTTQAQCVQTRWVVECFFIFLFISHAHHLFDSSVLLKCFLTPAVVSHRISTETGFFS